MNNKSNDCTEDGEINCNARREFIVRASAIAGGLLLSLPGLQAVQAKDVEKTAQKNADGQQADEIMLKLDEKNPLYKVGGFGMLKTKSGDVAIIHTAESQFKAFSAICTHKGGPLVYDAAKKQLVCTWHGSRFNMEGKVDTGPAVLDLTPYVVSSAIVVSLKSKS